MKKILFPTDYSANANNALEYAIEYANQIKASLTLLYVYDIPTSIDVVISANMHLKKEAIHNMEALMRKLYTKVDKGLPFDYIVRMGNIVTELTKLEEDYDLIIMGTHGATGLKETFIGSTTNAVIKHINIPLLVIPTGLRYEKIENVVLSVDNKPLKGLSTLKPVKDLLADFKADLLLFHVEPHLLNKGIDKSVHDLLSPIQYTINYMLDKDDINKYIDEMVRDYAVDLLVLIGRKRSWWEDLLHNSVISKEVFNPPVPLLILQDRAEKFASVVD